MAVIKVETDIITSIATSLIGRARQDKILVMYHYVKTFKNDTIVFIANITVIDVSLTDNFQYQNQSFDTYNIPYGMLWS